MLSSISPEEAYKKLQEGTARLVDVREPDELTTLRFPGAEAAPLSIIRWVDLRPARAEQPIIFTCNSGRRTRNESELLQQLAGGPAFQLEGGINNWVKKGLPVERDAKTLPMFRQIQIGAGSLVLLGLVGGLAWPGLRWLSAFVGAGLVFAGVTGFCGLALLLAAMPWNKK